MYKCLKCGCEKLHKRGVVTSKSHIEYQQYSCSSCKHRFKVELPKVVSKVDEVRKKDKFVITFYQKLTKVNEEFFETLVNYSEYNGAKLLVLTNADEWNENSTYSEYLVPYNFSIGDDITVYSKLNISPTAENPLTGLDTLSKGKSVIVGHNSMAMKMLPVYGDAHPIMMHTTGTISVPSYNTERKAGAKADMNHSYSAIVLEMDDGFFHFRQLNAGEDGSFYDLDKFYDGEHVSYSGGCEAIVLGDVHVTAADEETINATYKNADSIINVCRPSRIVMHDLLDWNLHNSHHNHNSIFSRYSKYVSGNNSVIRELDDTCRFLVDNTPTFVKENIVVSANHNDHIVKWMESNFDKLFDYKNLKVYHWLMYKTLSNIEQGREINPFRDYFEDSWSGEYASEVTKFLGRDELYFIGDILVSSHGDRGIGGSRGSVSQFKKLAYKTITGHSHSPSIMQGAWVAGTCTPTRLGYTAGTPTAWLNTHILIHKNFKRQMVSVIKGKWRV